MLFFQAGLTWHWLIAVQQNNMCCCMRIDAHLHGPRFHQEAAAPSFMATPQCGHTQHHNTKHIPPQDICLMSSSNPPINLYKQEMYSTTERRKNPYDPTLFPTFVLRPGHASQLWRPDAHTSLLEPWVSGVGYGWVRFSRCRLQH